ncbi:MAG: FtsX-like permease family protein, partial [Balneolaceae bacterium]|nr:FtsX-like permease family protein [Balneolaceae bacterium]
GTRRQLAVHFLGETALVTLLTFVAALGAAEVAVQYLRPLLGYNLELNLYSNGLLALVLAALFIATTLAAGLYPALYMSGFNPIEAIRNKIGTSYGEGLTLRRTLVVLQFAIAQLLIISTIVISSQMEYFRTADMGFDKEAVVEVDIPVRDASKLEVFKSRLEGHSAIVSAAYSNTGTAHGNIWGGNYEVMVGDSLREGDAQIKFVEPEFLDTYGVELLAGTNIVRSDTVTQYLVNEEFARETGFGNRYADLIGRRVEMWGMEAPIGGVVEDFNTNSLHREIQPVLLASRIQYQLAGIKIAAGRSQEALDVIREAYEAAFPDYVFDYIFLDKRIENFYKKERQMAQVMDIFTVIAILIGCLGLFGLVSYMAATRRKEVSIRKVLGATLSDILLLFSKEFFLLVGLSFLLAAPLAWLAMSLWLSDFAYRIELGPGLFALAFAATLAIAVATVGYKSLRAASVNPVENLNSE